MVLTARFPRAFLTLWLVTFLGYLIFQLLTASLPLYAVTLGADDAALGLLAGVIALISLLSRPWVGWWLDRGGVRWGMAVAGGFYALSALGFLSSRSVVALVSWQTRIPILHIRPSSCGSNQNRDLTGPRGERSGEPKGYPDQVFIFPSTNAFRSLHDGDGDHPISGPGNITMVVVLRLDRDDMLAGRPCTQVRSESVTGRHGDQPGHAHRVGDLVHAQVIVAIPYDVRLALETQHGREIRGLDPEGNRRPYGRPIIREKDRDDGRARDLGRRWSRDRNRGLIVDFDHLHGVLQSHVVIRRQGKVQNVRTRLQGLSGQRKRGGEVHIEKRRHALHAVVHGVDVSFTFFIRHPDVER